MGRAALFVGVLVLAGVLCGQDVVSVNDVSRADVIVVGTLDSTFRFPWFDGWNERGKIVVDQVIKGQIKVGASLPFAWERDFRPAWCLTRPDWNGAVGQRGIWLLAKETGQNRYRSLSLFAGLRPTADLPLINQALHTAAAK